MCFLCPRAAEGLVAIKTMGGCVDSRGPCTVKPLGQASTFGSQRQAVSSFSYARTTGGWALSRSHGPSMLKTIGIIFKFEREDFWLFAR